MAAERVQRQAVYLGTHQNDIVHRNNDFQGRAVGLSRLPPPNTEDEIEDKILLLEVDEYITLTSKDVGRESAEDPFISGGILHTLNGWRNSSNNAEMNPYFIKRN